MMSLLCDFDEDENAVHVILSAMSKADWPDSAWYGEVNRFCRSRASHIRQLYLMELKIYQKYTVTEIIIESVPKLVYAARKWLRVSEYLLFQGTFIETLCIGAMMIYVLLVVA